MAENKKARVRVCRGSYRSKEGWYRSKEGWCITGRNADGRSISIFTTTRCSAERIRARVKADEWTTLEDFKRCTSADCIECAIMSVRYELVNGGTIYEEPGHSAVAICVDPNMAQRIVDLLNSSSSSNNGKPKAKPKPKRKKPALSGAMSPGGAAWSEACRRGRTYEAMDTDKIRERANNICSRQEGKPGPPPGGAHYYLKYGPLANEARVELSKLGVPGHLITMQTREEWL